MKIKSVSELQSFFEDNYITLYDVLSCYTDCTNYSDIISTLECTESLSDFAEQNNISKLDLSSWIAYHVDCIVDCKVFIEHGPYNGWPVVRINCADKTFFIDWIIS